MDAIIYAAYDKTGKKVVVLIDEYEKPIIDNKANSVNLEDISRGDVRVELLTGVNYDNPRPVTHFFGNFAAQNRGS